MRATIMHAAGDVRIENVPDPSIIDPTDAIIRVTSACICGSDLWPYADMAPSETGQSMGHEALGIVEDTGPAVRSLKRGDLVVMPFAFSDGTCEFCHEGLNTACVHVGFFGNNGMDGAQAEALRIPFADGTLCCRGTRQRLPSPRRRAQPGRPDHRLCDRHRPRRRTSRSACPPRFRRVHRRRPDHLDSARCHRSRSAGRYGRRPTASPLREGQRRRVR